MAGRSALSIHEGSQPRVLIVDDNDVNNAMVRMVLERDQVRCTVVSSGEEALEELKRSTFDLVLLDVQMPGVSGFDVLRSIRERQSNLAFLPVILLSALSDKESRVQGLDAGATDFLTKPFDPAELAARVRNHIGAKRLYDKLMLTNQLLNEERAKIFEAQVELLPKAMPAVPGLRFGSGYLASNLASGDYYDVIERTDGSIILAVADVSGHGIRSAMQMSILRATLRARVANDQPIEAIMVDLNAFLRHSLDEYSFVTFYLAEFNPSTGELRSVSAGHHHPIRQDLETGRMTEISGPTCCPLGIDDNLELVVGMTRLRNRERLIIYTDGLTEQAHEANRSERFELAGVRSVLARGHTLGPQMATDQLILELRRYAGTNRPTDDVTILMMDVIDAIAAR